MIQLKQLLSSPVSWGGWFFCLFFLFVLFSLVLIVCLSFCGEAKFGLSCFRGLSYVVLVSLVLGQLGGGFFGPGFPVVDSLFEVLGRVLLLDLEVQITDLLMGRYDVVAGSGVLLLTATDFKVCCSRSLVYIVSSPASIRVSFENKVPFCFNFWFVAMVSYRSFLFFLHPSMVLLKWEILVLLDIGVGPPFGNGSYFIL